MKKETIQARFLVAKDKLRGIYAKAKAENRALTEEESMEAAELRS